MSLSASVTSNITTCPICLDTFDNPRSLPCLHSFCLECIRHYCEEKCPLDDVPCPLCRKEFELSFNGVIDLPHNFTIQGLIDNPMRDSRKSAREGAESPCEGCLEEEDDESRATDGPAATKYCVDCDQKLCEHCSRLHRRLRSGGHQVVALGTVVEQELAEARGGYCQKHSNRRLKLYCLTCQENICLVCSALRHNCHERAEIADLADDFKSQINSDIEQIASRISGIKRELRKTADEMNKLTADVEKLGADIKSSGDDVKPIRDVPLGQIIDDQVRERLDELNSVRENQLKMAEAVKDDLQLRLGAAESFLLYSRELLDNGRPSDITGAAADLQNTARELMTKSSDVISAGYRAPSITFISYTPPASDISMDNVGQLEIRQPESCKEARPVYTFPDGEPVWGIALLGNNVYLLRPKGYDEVEEYDKVSFRLLRRLTVPDADSFTDMTSCQRFLRLYIADPARKCVHSMAVRDVINTTMWQVDDEPTGLSVTATHNLLVTCDQVGRIKEFNTVGDLVREIALPGAIVSPWHTVQLSSGQLVVSHGALDDVKRLSILSSDGQQLTSSHTGTQRAPESVVSDHLAVDNNDSVFVVDSIKRQVDLYSATLSHTGPVVSSHQCEWSPHKLCLDVARRRLYVADNDTTLGRAVVFTV